LEIAQIVNLDAGGKTGLIFVFSGLLVVLVVTARGRFSDFLADGYVGEGVLVVAHLEQLLSHFFYVSGDRYEVTGGETEQNVTVAEPFVGDDRAVVRLERQLDRIVGV
jgi:hypothetical protein